MEAKDIEKIRHTIKEIEKVILSSDESEEEKTTRLNALKLVSSVVDSAIKISESFKSGGISLAESHQGGEVVLNKREL